MGYVAGKELREAEDGSTSQPVQVAIPAHVVAGSGQLFGGLCFTSDSSEMIARRPEEAFAQEQGQRGGLHALTDVVFVKISWANWLRAQGKLTDDMLRTIRRPPAERTASCVRVIENFFAEIPLVQNLHFVSRCHICKCAHVHGRCTALSYSICTCLMNDRKLHDVLCKPPQDALKTQLCKNVMHKRLHNNEVLFKQGAEAEHYYVIIKGYIRVIKDGLAVQVLHAGDAFGESVLGGSVNERIRDVTIIGGSVPNVPGAPDHDDPEWKPGTALCCPGTIQPSSFLQEWHNDSRSLL